MSNYRDIISKEYQSQESIKIRNYSSLDKKIVAHLVPFILIILYMRLWTLSNHAGYLIGHIISTLSNAESSDSGNSTLKIVLKVLEIIALVVLLMLSAIFSGFYFFVAFLHKTLLFFYNTI